MLGSDTTIEQTKKEQKVIDITATGEKTNFLPYFFLTPSFILIIAFVYIPITIALVVSFFENPGLVQLSEDFLGYYTDMGNGYFIGLGTLIQGMVDNGFYPIFHALTIAFGTVVGKKMLNRIRPEYSDGIAYFLSLIFNLVFSTILLYGIIFGIISTGNSIRVPLRNYFEIFTSPLIIGDFLRILLNTALWALICTFFHVTLGIFLAVLLNGDFPGRQAFRAVFILPWAIPSFITALIWRNFIFDQNRGILGRPVGNAVESGALTEIVVTFADIIMLIIFLGIVVRISVTLRDYEGSEKLIRGALIPVLAVITWLVFSLNTTVVPVLGGDFLRIDELETKFWYASDLYILGYETKTIFLAAILTNIWLGVPFMMLSFLASLQSIPDDLYEAAELDGASAWGQFRSITFPNLVPTLRTVALLGMIWTFNLFNVFYILSQNQTALGRRQNYDIFITYIYYLFNQGTSGAPEYAAAAALSFVVFLILVGFSKMYEKLFPEEE